MIDQTEPEQAFVWADDGKGRLEKRQVELGDYDENLLEYQILSGLELTDSITYPETGLEEGMKTAPGEKGLMGQAQPESQEQMPEAEGGAFEETGVME